MRKTIFAVTLGMLPVMSMGLGLGEIQLHSVLYQPLNAEIKLVDTQGMQWADIKVNLATAEDFKRFGVDRPSNLDKIHFQVLEKATGSVIIATSTEPLNEPFLNFLLDITWANGRLFRQYTVLLDPPGYTQKLNTPPPQKTAITTPNPPSIIQPQKMLSAAMPALVPPDPGSVIQSQQTYGPVQRADTLWEIGIKHRPSQTITVEQTMVAILGANPKAFIDGNMNRLKAGQALQIPTAGQMQHIASSIAKHEIMLHHEAWQAFRRGERKNAHVVMDPAIQTALQQQETQPSVAAPVMSDVLPPPLSDHGASPLVLRSPRYTLYETPDEIPPADEARQNTAEQQLSTPMQLKLQQLAQQNQQLQAEIAQQRAELAILQKKFIQQQTTSTTSQRHVDQPLQPRAMSGTAVAIPLKQHRGNINQIVGLILLGIVLASGFLGWQYRLWRVPLLRKLFGEWYKRTANVFASTKNKPVMTVTERKSMIIDPLKRAAEYLHQQQEEKAEAILLKSLAIQPRRLELYTKLLEIYAARIDQPSFLSMMNKVPEDLRRAHPESWQEIQGLYSVTWPRGNSSPCSKERPFLAIFARKMR